MSITADHEVRETIRELEGRRYDAMLRGDFEGFTALCHPDLVYVHSSGVVDSLDSYLEECRRGTYVYHAAEHPVDEIVVEGDVALVVGRMDADISVSGRKKRLENVTTAVWVRHDHDWRLLAFQGTPSTT